MKKDTSSHTTKTELSKSLKRFMEQKPLLKITISDLVRDCKINRKTFYYHFDNIYELLKWTLEQEAITIVKEFDLLTDFKDALLFVESYIERNSYILNCAYDGIGRDELKKFLYNDFYEIIVKLVDESEKKLDVEVSDEFKLFICNSYIEVLVGTLIDYLKNTNTQSINDTINYLSLLFSTTIPVALKEGAKNKY